MPDPNVIHDARPSPEPGEAREPLPIWFFVGLILGVFGLLVLAAAPSSQARVVVPALPRPGLAWGGLMVGAGGMFLAVGLRGRRRPAARGAVTPAPAAVRRPPSGE